MSAGPPAPGIPPMETLEVVSVGLPFCAFKIVAGAALRAGGGGWGGVGTFLVALGAADVLFSGANLAGLILIRRRVLDACFLAFAARLFQAPTRKSRWTLRDCGNSLDMLVSFSIVAWMVGAGRLPALPPRSLSVWNAAVVLSVLGAGLARFTESVRNLSEDAALE